MSANITYQNQRTNFEIIARKYKEYVSLYRLINHGSIQGLSPFAEFYWRYTYYNKYSNPGNVRSMY